MISHKRLTKRIKEGVEKERYKFGIRLLKAIVTMETLFRGELRKEIRDEV